MPTRRFLLASSVPVILSGSAFASEAESFRNFLIEVRTEARKAGIRPATLEHAFAGVAPNQKVLDRDRRQPEFTMTWARYRSLVITDKRIADGRQAVTANRVLFRHVEQRYGVGAGIVAGIWGLESSFGTGTGDFRVVEALATLAWEGRRARFFREELMAALKILDHGDIAPGEMTGSYAGAMGQPQFMPTSYLRYAVDFDGHGRRDIWTSKPDVLGSIANYLAQSGWRAGEVWGQAVTLPAGLTLHGRDAKRSLSDWARAGVRPNSGRWAATGETLAGLLAPDAASSDAVNADAAGRDGAGPDAAHSDAFAVFANFDAIRRYNPSDFYAIAVGLIGDQVVV